MITDKLTKILTRIAILLGVALLPLCGCQRVDRPNENGKISISLDLPIGFDNITKGDGTENSPYSSSSLGGMTNVGGDGIHWYVAIFPSDVDFSSSDFLSKASYISTQDAGATTTGDTFSAEDIPLTFGDYILVAVAALSEQKLSDILDNTPYTDRYDEGDIFYHYKGAFTIGADTYSVSASLTLPFGKIRVVSDDFNEYCANSGKSFKNSTISYTGSRFSTFDIYSGEWSSSSTNPAVTATSLNYYSDETPNSFSTIGPKTIIVDYIPLSDASTITYSYLGIQMILSDDETKEFTLTSVPVQKGSLTTISGRMFYNLDAGLNITIDDTFTPVTLPQITFTPQGYELNQQIKAFLSTHTGITKIKFVANSTQVTHGNLIEFVKNGEYLELHTSQDKFYLNIDISGLFEGLTDITSIDFNNVVDSQYAEDWTRMFYQCTYLTEVLGINNLNTSRAISTVQMFKECTSLVSLDLGDFSRNTKNLRNMSEMFCGCSSLTTLSLEYLNIKSLKGTRDMLIGCDLLENFNISKVNVSDKYFLDEFSFNYFIRSGQGSISREIANLKNLDISGWTNTQNLLSLSSFFSYTSIENITFFDTSSIKYMGSLFYQSYATNLNLIGLNTSSVTEMQYMFYGCTYLAELNISGFSFASNPITNSIFSQVGYYNFDNTSTKTKIFVSQSGYDYFFNSGSTGYLTPGTDYNSEYVEFEIVQ